MEVAVAGGVGLSEAGVVAPFLGVASQPSAMPTTKTAAINPMMPKTFENLRVLSAIQFHYSADPTPTINTFGAHEVKEKVSPKGIVM